MMGTFGMQLTMALLQTLEPTPVELQGATLLGKSWHVSTGAT
jgi:hypothetical protein